MKINYLLFIAGLFCAMAFFACKKANPTTVTISPANNPTEFNVNLWGSSDYSNGTSIEEPLCAWTKDGVPVTMRELLQFNLGQIPPRAAILKAHLYLYSDTIPLNGNLTDANFGANNAIVVQQIAASWNPQTVNWFNQPNGLAENSVTVPSTTQPFLNLDIDVTNLMKSMVQSGANYGFKLMLQNETTYTSRIFCSSYYSDATRHPKLVVTYE